MLVFFGQIVTALTLAGRLSFNPLVDTLTGAKGEQFKLNSPTGEELPPRGFDPGQDTYQPPAADGSSVQVQIDPKSQRLQLLPKFDAWNGKDALEDMPVLIKAKVYTCASSLEPIDLSRHDHHSLTREPYCRANVLQITSVWRDHGSNTVAILIT